MGPKISIIKYKNKSVTAPPDHSSEDVGRQDHRERLNPRTHEQSSKLMARQEGPWSPATAATPTRSASA